MLERFDFFSPRNLILLAASVLVLSVVGMCLSMLGPKDSGGTRQDSFGTRYGGHRALFELLEALEVPVRREWTPPQPAMNSRHTLVLLNPNPLLLGTSPKYVKALLPWIEAGGSVVVSPSARRADATTRGTRNAPSEYYAPMDILDGLEIDDAVELGDFSEEFTEQDYTSTDGAEDLPANRWWGGRQQPAPPLQCDTAATGSLASLTEEVRQIALPAEGFATLRAKRKYLAGSVTCIDANGKEHLLVAAVRRGAGEVIVVADRALFMNGLIAEADNSVLAAHLFAPLRAPVVFDEFYHGLAVRGNPFYLLTRPGFAAVAMGLLLVVGTVAWRAAVFLGPPVSRQPAMRRDIGEYIRAMARFFSRGRGSRQFLIREIRDGVLREVCRELKLPMDTLQVESITTALARRDRERARRLDTIIREVDAKLAAAGDFPRHEFLPITQRLLSCL